MRYVAMLRGINVGGKNLVPMKELAALFERAGCADVRTYIQSGNVVFSGTRPLAESLAETIGNAMQRKFGFSPSIVVRSQAELQAAVRRNPFAEGKGDVHVMFLRSAPRPADVAQLDPQRSPGDRFEVLGREIYLLVTNGMAKTKLSNAYFENVLKTASTARNWRTVLALDELLKNI